MNKQKKLESTMDEYFVKNAPFQIPANGRKAIVSWAPILAMIGALLSIFAAYSLWQAGHRVDEIVQVVNSYARASGVDTIREIGPVYYISLIVLVAQAALLLAAYPGLKTHSKARGWDLLLLGVLASFVYGIIVAFTDYGGLSNIIVSVIGAVIGLYILAQIRGHYNDGKTPSDHNKS